MAQDIENKDALFRKSINKWEMLEDLKQSHENKVSVIEQDLKKQLERNSEYEAQAVVLIKRIEVSQQDYDTLLSSSEAVKQELEGEIKYLKEQN